MKLVSLLPLCDKSTLATQCIEPLCSGQSSFCLHFGTLGRQRKSTLRAVGSTASAHGGEQVGRPVPVTPLSSVFCQFFFFFLRFYYHQAGIMLQAIDPKSAIVK